MAIVAHKPLLTPDEAADFLSLSTETLAQWRSQRRGPNYIKLEGRLVRYRTAELERYLEERIVKTIH
jgi:excisionase family DNA binding protein